MGPPWAVMGRQPRLTDLTQRIGNQALQMRCNGIACANRVFGFQCIQDIHVLIEIILDALADVGDLVQPGRDT